MQPLLPVFQDNNFDYIYQVLDTPISAFQSNQGNGQSKSMARTATEGISPELRENPYLFNPLEEWQGKPLCR